MNSLETDKGVLFHQDNAHAHKSVVAMAVALNWLITLCIDLAPSDYFLFPNMKKHLAGKQYQTNDDVISAAEDFFEDQDESFYTTGSQALQHRWKKFVDRRGDYVEK